MQSDYRVNIARDLTPLNRYDRSVNNSAIILLVIHLISRVISLIARSPLAHHGTIRNFDYYFPVHFWPISSKRFVRASLEAARNDPSLTGLSFDSRFPGHVLPSDEIGAWKNFHTRRSNYWGGFYRATLATRKPNNELLEILENIRDNWSAAKFV